LINRLEEVKKELNKKSRENGKNNTTAINELVDENVTNVTE
jgi:CRISPR/Cas system CSM-associated protein Csm2 small subunit